MWKSWLIFIIFFGAHQKLKAGELRGVDFRFQYVTGVLDFTSISGIPRQFTGTGTELQASIYVFEKNKFRTSIFIASKIINWVGQDVVSAEYDDVQMFSVSPGLEFQYGVFYVAASSSHTNANAYYISSTSKGAQFAMDGLSLSGGLSWKFGNFGMGLTYTSVNSTVSGSQLGLNSDSSYLENSYGFNLIYYMGMKPSKFFKNLWK